MWQTVVVVVVRVRAVQCGAYVRVRLVYARVWRACACARAMYARAFAGMFASLIHQHCTMLATLPSASAAASSYPFLTLHTIRHACTRRRVSEQ